MQHITPVHEFYKAVFFFFLQSILSVETSLTLKHLKSSWKVKTQSTHKSKTKDTKVNLALGIHGGAS